MGTALYPLSQFESPPHPILGKILTQRAFPVDKAASISYKGFFGATTLSGEERLGARRVPGGMIISKGTRKKLDITGDYGLQGYVASGDGPTC